MAIHYFTMAKIARVVVPGIAHHITRRGKRRQETFFIDGDYQELTQVCFLSSSHGKKQTKGARFYAKNY